MGGAVSTKKDFDFEIIKQRLSDKSFVYAVQIHWGIGKRMTPQCDDQARARALLAMLSDAVCWIDDED